VSPPSRRGREGIGDRGESGHSIELIQSGGEEASSQLLTGKGGDLNLGKGAGKKGNKTTRKVKTSLAGEKRGGGGFLLEELRARSLTSKWGKKKKGKHSEKGGRAALGSLRTH